MRGMARKRDMIIMMILTLRGSFESIFGGGGGDVSLTLDIVFTV